MNKSHHSTTEREKKCDTPLEEVEYKPITNSCEVLKPEMKSKSESYFLYLASSVANLTAFVAGLAFGWTSPVLPKLNGNVDPDNNPLGYPITSLEESWIAGMLSLGAIFGPLISGPMANKIGRKKTLLIMACPMVLSLVMSAFATTVLLFYIARLLMGVGAGSIYTVLPMYLSEIGETHNRGTLGCLMTVFITFGFLFTYSAGPFLTVRNFCLVCTVPLLIFIPVFFIWIPETPQFLALVDDQRGLEASLSKLRNKTPSEIQKELLEIQRNVQEDVQSESGVKELFRSRIHRKALTIVVALIIFQQFAGINAVLSYMQAIFDATGSGLAPEVSTIIVGSVQVCTAVFTSSIVDRLGRRILFLTSSTGSGLSLVALGVYFYLKTHQFDVGAIGWLPVSSLLVFIVSFNLGYAPLPFAVMAELFPPSVKPVASTINSVVCFVACFVITSFFPSLSLILGMAQSFWVFAFMCALGTTFIYLMLPETSGRSLQEIQRFRFFQANLFALFAGICAGWTSPALPKLNGSVELDDNPLGRPITRLEQSWIAALLPLGAIGGTLVAGRMADQIGRKKSLLIMAAPMAVGLLMTTFVKKISLFYISRFLMGIGSGGVLTVLPMFLGEIAEDHNRGTFGSLTIVFITVGSLFAYAIGPFLTIRNFGLACLSPVLIFVPIFSIWIPETPQFFASIHNDRELKASLLKLRNKTSEEIENELLFVTRIVENKSQNRRGIKDLIKTKASRKGLAIALVAVFLQQFTGISAVTFYLQTIFDATESKISPEISTIIIGTIQTCTAIFTSSVIDKFGRKILLLTSSIGVSLSLVALGVYFYLKTNQFDVSAIFWLPVVSLVSFVVSFYIGLGPVPWALLAEIFPPSVKAPAMTVASLDRTLGRFIITLFFPSLSAFLGIAQTFWVFAIICAAGAVFTYW
ncbi:uncharacterized protein BDFB_003458, partial [Asbolus verrucosus]